MNTAAVLSSAIALVVAAPVEPRRPGQDSFLTRAIFAEGRVWMLSDAGIVFSVSEGESKRREESLPGAARDLCSRNGQVVVLASEGDSWTVRRRDEREWVAEASIDAANGFVALHCAPRAVTVVTARRVFVVRDGKASSVALSSPLPLGLVANLHIEGDQLFVGVNRGEFGGGLSRVNLNTGLVTHIDRRTGELCGGPLNGDCDPVHGIATEPWKPGCVVAAIGLVHFIPHGRLVEICGDEVRTLVSRPYRTGAPGGNRALEDVATVAFFGVARSGDVVLAAGVDGLYRVSTRSVEREPLPDFKDVGGMKVSFDVPGFVLVLTDVNSRKSMR